MISLRINGLGVCEAKLGAFLVDCCPELVNPTAFGPAADIAG